MCHYAALFLPFAASGSTLGGLPGPIPDLLVFLSVDLGVRRIIDTKREFVLHVIRRHFFGLVDVNRAIPQPLHHRHWIGHVVSSSKLNVAVGHDLQDTEPTFLQPFDHKVLKELAVINRAARDKVGPRSHRPFRDLKGVFAVPVRRRRRVGTVGGCGRELSAGHAVDLIVDNDGIQIKISARCMDEVIATDSGCVSVTHDAVGTDLVRASVQVSFRYERIQLVPIIDPLGVDGLISLPNDIQIIEVAFGDLVFSRLGALLLDHGL